MISFKKYISEGIALQLVRGDGQDILKMWDTKEKSWVELRGKPNFEIKFDSKDKLHDTITKLGKAASISDFVNSDVVHVNPHHPDGKKAIDTIKKLMR